METVFLAAAVATAPCGERPRVLYGDVDSDGARDRVQIAVTERRASCRFALVARTRHREYRVRLPVLVTSPTVPQLVRVARLGEEMRSQIVVSVDAGASTAFLAAYTLRDRVLRRMWIQGRGPARFSAFGSVAHPSWVDCRAGAVVAVGGENRGAVWAIVRTTYRVEGLAFVPTQQETFFSRRWLAPPGLTPFSRCPGG